jgi:hypothetical protein
MGIVMKRTFLATLAALSACAPVFAPAADGDRQRAERVQQWAADRETMLDAKLAGMKAGLRLNTDQEKLWSPFEFAVKDADKSRMDGRGIGPRKATLSSEIERPQRG